MPQYKKVFDIGTYTGNGGQYRVGVPTLRGVGPSGFQDAGSLRFRNSNGTNNAYLSRTFGSAGNRKTWTFSCWFKIGTLYSSANGGHIFDYNSGSGYNRTYHQLVNGNLEIGDYTTAWSWQVTTTQVFKDTAKWYHYVVAFDTTQATAANRVIMYIDGQRITTYKNASYPSQNYDAYINQAAAHSIGGIGYNAGSSFDGYMSEMYFVGGQALTPSSFGEYNSDGIWVPKAYSGTYGTNGFYLPMNSSSNYATDQSGNSNNWTPNNFNVTTANTTYDLVTDSPTDYSSGTNNIGNYAVLNASDNPGSMTVAFGGLAFYKTSTYASVPATIKVTSGKWYFECGYVSDTAAGYGIGAAPAASFPYTAYMGQTVGCSIWKGTGGTTLYLNGSTNTGRSITAGDTMVCALDCDNGKIWVGYYSVSAATTYWLDSSGGVTGNPATGTNPSGTFTAGTLMAPGATFYSSGTYQFINFGQRAFTLTPPTGFVALNTYNITRPAESSLWFYGDTPDLMWIKNRSTTGLHTLTDTVRGMGLNLVTSSTAAETSYPAVTEMNKFGMTVINDATSIVNGSGNSMVYWGWKAGSNTSSTAVSNASGNASNVMVSSNPSAGFSIVTYTGNGLVSTVGHGLGTTPSLIFGHSRSRAGERWPLWHTSAGTDNYFELNSTAAAGAGSTIFRSSAMSSTVFGIGANASVNNSGDTYVMYCFAAIPGYSAFGSYTGNGSADGPFIYTGFRPKWLLTKRTDTLDSWQIQDFVRQTYNPTNLALNPNSTAVDNSDVNGGWDFVSNGLKCRCAASAATNASGGTYIYAAFAEIPFKYARSR